jgi:hypothetical protein
MSARKQADVAAAVVGRRELHHNRRNAVTQSVELVTLEGGQRIVEKRLGRERDGAAAHWVSSDDPTHWNYWEREALAYRSRALVESLEGTGLRVPVATVVDEGATRLLRLEHIEGRTGTEFTLDDHLAVAAGLGRWNARPAIDEWWMSRQYLRRYPASKPAPWELVDDDAVWGLPVLRTTIRPGLRESWRRLIAATGRLREINAALPRVTAHLDVWPANEIRDHHGTVVLIDWGFVGDGAIGEDLGNHIPDSVFDRFWPPEQLEELAEAAFDAYLGGLGEAGWKGDPRVARLGVTSAAVKYTWLLPLRLAAAREPQQQLYDTTATAEEAFVALDAGCGLLVAWAEEALEAAGRLGL